MALSCPQALLSDQLRVLRALLSEYFLSWLSTRSSPGVLSDQSCAP